MKTLTFEERRKLKEEDGVTSFREQEKNSKSFIDFSFKAGVWSGVRSEGITGRPDCAGHSGLNRANWFWGF